MSLTFWSRSGRRWEGQSGWCGVSGLETVPAGTVPAAYAGSLSNNRSDSSALFRRGGGYVLRPQLPSRAIPSRVGYSCCNWRLIFFLVLESHIDYLMSFETVYPCLWFCRYFMLSFACQSSAFYDSVSLTSQKIQIPWPLIINPMTSSSWFDDLDLSQFSQWPWSLRVSLNSQGVQSPWSLLVDSKSSTCQGWFNDHYFPLVIHFLSLPLLGDSMSLTSPGWFSDLECPVDSTCHWQLPVYWMTMTSPRWFSELDLSEMIQWPWPLPGASEIQWPWPLPDDSMTLTSPRGILWPWPLLVVLFVEEMSLAFVVGRLLEIFVLQDLMILISSSIEIFSWTVWPWPFLKVKGACI